MNPFIAAVDLSQGVEDAWTQIATFVPRLFGFLLIVIVGYFIVKAISKVLDKALDRVGFDRAVERGGVAKAMAKSQYDASDLVSKVVFYFLFLFVLRAAFGVLGVDAISDLLDSVIAYLPKLFAAIVIIVVASAIAAAVREIVVAAIGGLSYGKLVGSVAGVAILAIGGFAALSQLEIAPAIVNGLFYAIVGTLAGILVISIGAGGVKPMQSRWESAFAKFDEETKAVKNQHGTAADRIKDQAATRADQARDARDNFR